MSELSPDSLLILESLRTAVAKALERKRLLNQYAVIWEDGKPVFLGNLPEHMVQTDEDGKQWSSKGWQTIKFS